MLCEWIREIMPSYPIPSRKELRVQGNCLSSHELISSRALLGIHGVTQSPRTGNGIYSVLFYVGVACLKSWA